MYLMIRHQTVYCYESPVHYSIQHLRLTPGSGGAQLVRRWTVDAPGKLDATRDAYGNVLHTVILTRPHSEICVRVEGEVQTMALADGRLPDGPGPIPIEHFTCATHLTEANEAVRELASRVPSLALPRDLIALADEVVRRVRYQPGVTGVASTAADALALGQGVCQDHAHLMLACCRARGVPARYVSGYVEVGDLPHGASHAWVDVWLDGEGWVSIDVTHSAFASERYCRLAVARDYSTAAPVRGTRIGGLKESLDVAVSVAESPQ
jgi:transglutaminase-like putative cysteine protease